MLRPLSKRTRRYVYVRCCRRSGERWSWKASVKLEFLLQRVLEGLTESLLEAKH